MSVVPGERPMRPVVRERAGEREREKNEGEQKEVERGKQGE